MMQVARHTRDGTRPTLVVSRPVAKHLRNSRNGEPSVRLDGE